MSTKKAEIAVLDKWFPPCGPCAFCGHRDKRHRLWDTFMGEYEGKAHWTMRQIFDDFDGSYPLEAIEAVLRIRPYRRAKT